MEDSANDYYGRGNNWNPQRQRESIIRHTQLLVTENMTENDLMTVLMAIRWIPSEEIKHVIKYTQALITENMSGFERIHMLT